MRSPTIAIDARYIRERPSGIGSMVEAIVRDVPALMPDTSFLLLRHPLAPCCLSQADNVRETVVPYEANGPGTLLMLPRVVDLSEVDLFHAPFNILPAGLAMRTVVTIHDTMWLTDPTLCGAAGLWGKVQTWFYRHGIRRALEQADHLIAISDATRRDIIAQEPSAASRCTTILHGIAPKFSPARDESERSAQELARQRFAPGARRHVLVVGRAAPYKNQQRSLLAFLRAFPESPDIHMIVVQRLGHEGAAFASLAREAGAEDRIHVVPPMDERDLISLYRGALCLCQPSIKEGWGMPIGEAMACGCPVITSNTSAMPEVGGRAALYVTPTSVSEIARSLKKLARDPILRAKLVEAGLEQAERLTWASHARSTARLYRQLLTSRARAAA
ncbi:MAG: glycosyltransferase family 4 protein [Coriobacteriia bacterium]